MPDKAAAYKVLIAGRELPIDPRHIRVISAEESFEDTAKCDITIMDSHEFRLIPNDVKLGSRVDVFLGYVDELTRVFLGEIVKITPEFPQARTPSLTITCYDLSYRLKRQERDRVITPKEGEKIDILGAIRQIVSDPNSEYGLELIVHPEGKLTQYSVEGLRQENETDMETLDRLAESFNLNLFSKFGIGDLDESRSYLYLVDDDYLLDKQTYRGRFVYNLSPSERGENDIIMIGRFRPQLSVVGQFQGADMNFWLTESNEDQYAKIDLEDLIAASIDVLGDAVNQILEVTGLKDEKTPENQAQAKQKLVDGLMRARKNLVTGDIEVQGNPKIQIGQEHDFIIHSLGEFGKMYSGAYFVKRVQHLMSPDRGFVTAFDVRRDEVTAV